MPLDIGGPKGDQFKAAARSRVAWRWEVEMAVVQSVEGAGPWVRIRLAGEIDVAATDLVRETVANALAAHANASVLEIDCRYG